MCGRGDDVSVFQRIVQQSGGYEPGGVSHINHKNGAYFIGYFAHAGIVPFARVSRGSADNQFRTFAQGYLFHHVIIDVSGIFFHTVLQRVEHQSGEIYGASVRKVASM